MMTAKMNKMMNMIRSWRSVSVEIGFELAGGCLRIGMRAAKEVKRGMKALRRR